MTPQRKPDRRWDKSIAAWAIRCGVLAVTERQQALKPNVLRILAYHRIGYPEDAVGMYVPSLISATPEGFAQQMGYLAENYRVLSLEDLLFAVSCKQPLPPRSVLITFDDGYRDFLDYAWPVLRRYRLNAVLFVATDFLSDDGRLYWWDALYRALFQTERSTLSLPPYGEWPLRSCYQREHAFAELKQIVAKTDHSLAMDLLGQVQDRLEAKPSADNGILSWRAVSQLSRDGLYIGAHTRSHPILSRLPLWEARQEVIDSQSDLQKELGRTWPIFAFPFGHPSHLRQDLLSSLEEAGFQIALTMIAGHNAMGKSHPLRLKRLGMAPHLSLAEFRLALTGVYDVYGALQNLSQSLRGRREQSSKM